jgi:hypothetical protein
MYLLNAPTTIQWEILPTNSPPALADLDLLILDPLGNSVYTDSPILVENYIPPTDTTPGTVTYIIIPQYEGLWRIRLVVGTSASYQILSKAEMYVFDNTTVTSPYTDEIGRPAPYDINFYLQGYIVPSEIYGIFVASRTISLDTDAPGSKAIAEVPPSFFDVTLSITHNGTEIGTILFAVGQVNGVISLNPQLISTGDRLQIEVQGGVVDGDIRDIAINLVGCCTVVPCTVL